MGRFMHQALCLLWVAPVLSIFRGNDYRRNSLVGRYRYVSPSSPTYYPVPGAPASTYPHPPVYPSSGDKYPESYPTHPTPYYPPSEYNAPPKPYGSDQYSNQEYEAPKSSLYPVDYGKLQAAGNGDYRQSGYSSDHTAKSAEYEDSYTSVAYDSRTAAARSNIPLKSSSNDDYKLSGNDYKSSGNVYKSSGNDYKSSGNDYKSSGNDYKSSGSDYKSSGSDYKSSGNDYKSSGNDYKSSGNDYKSSGNDYKSSGNDYKSSGNDYKSSGSDYKSSGNDYKSSGNDYKSSGNDYKPSGNDYKPSGNDYKSSGNDYKSSGNDYKSSGNDYKSSGNDYKSSGSDYKSSGNDYKSSGNDYKSSGNDYKSSGNDYKSSGNDYKSSGNDYKSSGSDYKSSGNDYKSSGSDYKSSGNDYKSSGNDYKSSGYDNSKSASYVVPKSSDYDDYKPSGNDYKPSGYASAYGSSEYGGNLGTSLGSQIVKFGNGYTSLRRLEATDANNDLYLSSGSTNYLYILQKYGMKEDPCKHGVRAFPVWDVCFAYFTCEVDGYGKANGVKWHDCGDGNRFDAGQGRCVSDPTCKSACQNAPHIKPTYDPYKFVLGDKVMDCAAGTYFDFRQCTCDHISFVNGLNALESARNRKHSFTKPLQRSGRGRDGRKVDEKLKNLETTSKARSS
ncbi:hypothetical protein C0Q70_09081 [Pomacea canaliculata]|uniref:Chitin-binding type-2 domain-containing protein n=1 Tax=Pomacea canaliculata TaxID=400727 RepID=A0A2T7P8T2_POMCA|nr:hypothetical protein C0Q70_09081 [Pomacea canaliculata]